MSKFNSTHNKGFQMTFDNGFRLSVQWGIGNYCQRKSDGMFGDEMKDDFWESTSAEIAVFDDKVGESSPMVNLNGGMDMVCGWLSTDQVAKVIAIVSSATTADEISKKCQALNL
jgi:hypothetical protein